MDSNRCLLCNAEIEDQESRQLIRCEFCGDEKWTFEACPQGHFVCDTCKYSSAADLIVKVCNASDSSDPLQIMELIARHPSIHIRGPEYHFMVPAVLLTAYYNAIHQENELCYQLTEALKRSKEISSGSCGYNGVCGSAIGAGIFMSLILHTTPLSLKGWKHRNQLVAGALDLIGSEGDPRCCKRNAYLAINHTIDIMQKDFNIPMNNSGSISCIHIEPNQECVKSKCRFYRSFDKKNSPDRLIVH